MIGHRSKTVSAVGLAAALAAAAATTPRTAGGGDATDLRTGDHLTDRYHWTMGTLARVTVWGAEDARIVSAIDECFGELDRVDAVMTTWTAESEISRVNAAAGGRAVKVSEEVIGLLRKAQETSEITGGAFDITVGSFAGLWKFDQDNDGTIPTKEQVEERRKLVDWKDVVVDARKKTVRLKRKGQRITLGGLAKGYGVDRCAELMRRLGLTDFIVQAGGDLYASGRRGAEKWPVGIRDPRGELDVLFAVAEVEDAAFSTSADTERYVIKDGVRYHHILDPSTGYPAVKCRSVTVLAKDATTAEGLTKALFIMGPEKGIPWLQKRGLGEAVIVGADNKVTISRGLAGKVTLVTQPTGGI